MLILARPDHSFSIYEALNKQREITFLYATFGLYSKMFSFLGVKKMRFVNGNTRIFKLFTLLHILHYKLKLTKRFEETKLFNQYSKAVLKSVTPQIIHYWPNFSSGSIDVYKTLNPSVITIADAYMPNPIVILDEMKTVYKRYGKKFNNKYLENYASRFLKTLDSADFIAVPSSYMEDTYKVSFPHKKYIQLPYGITISPSYSYKIKKSKITKFVYVGGISLEKGVDIILKYFSNHATDKELHLFGSINSAQNDIFSVYQGIKNIVFHGSVSKQELFEQFQFMDVGIHSSRFDAYSLAVGEEVGSGLPVIVSDHTGIKDDVDKNGWGVIYETENLQSLDNAVEFITNLKNYNKIQANIDRYIRSGSSIDYGENVISVYKGLLKNVCLG